VAKVSTTKRRRSKKKPVRLPRSKKTNGVALYAYSPHSAERKMIVKSACPREPNWAVEVVNALPLHPAMGLRAYEFGYQTAMSVAILMELRADNGAPKKRRVARVLAAAAALGAPLTALRKIARADE
jgi:hypothetical protein